MKRQWHRTAHQQSVDPGRRRSASLGTGLTTPTVRALTPYTLLVPGARLPARINLKRGRAGNTDPIDVRKTDSGHGP